MWCCVLVMMGRLVIRLFVSTGGEDRNANVLTSKVASNVKPINRTKGRRGCGLLFLMAQSGRNYWAATLSR
jgi:hypothetical protein